MDQNLNQNVQTLFNNMQNFTQNEGLIGKPVTQGDKTFLPVVSITLGYGGGDTQKKGAPNTSNANGSNSGALGLGAKLCAEAVIVIDKNNVSMAHIGQSGNVSQMIDKIPQIVNSMSSSTSASANPQSNQSTTNTTTNS